MTLLCSYSLGGIVSVLTCDTRRVVTFGNKDIKIPISDADSKIHQITDSIFCAGGGFDSIVNFIVENVKERILRPVDTLRIENIIKDIDELVQIKYKKDLKKGICSQILIAGFNVLGVHFTLNYNPDAEADERLFYQTLEYGAFGLSGAFPEGYEGALSSLQEASSQIHANMTESEMAQTLLISIAKLQQVIHLAEPNEVSETLCYSIVLRERGSTKPIIISNKLNIIEPESDEVTE